MSKSVLVSTSEVCAGVLTGRPLDPADAARLSPMLKALADPVRLRMLSLVAAHDGGEACVCDLHEAFELSQPTISHHLKVLVEAGLLHREKRGVWVFHRVDDGALHDLGTLLDGLAR